MDFAGEWQLGLLYPNFREKTTNRLKVLCERLLSHLAMASKLQMQQMGGIFPADLLQFFLAEMQPVQ